MSTSIWSYLFSGLNLCAKAHIRIAMAQEMLITGVVKRNFIIGGNLHKLSIMLL